MHNGLMHARNYVNSPTVAEHSPYNLNVPLDGSDQRDQHYRRQQKQGDSLRDEAALLAPSGSPDGRGHALETAHELPHPPGCFYTAGHPRLAWHVPPRCTSSVRTTGGLPHVTQEEWRSQKGSKQAQVAMNMKQFISHLQGDTEPESAALGRTRSFSQGVVPGRLYLGVGYLLRPIVTCADALKR